ncbi:glycosyltransferase [Agromyces atrinae]|uniref:4,4'-diaponeurosporenoate glycosyltransferase n=1 Tax=Agromyces atrinae TaxID=592376 RepID=A0A852S4S2_9MICO|nr:glycosyltransferase family A protein [Agromyces atrinae]NYD67422.1 glycosyltransferase involved in cell wall biosynthesis [Agromyces atrinae]
MIVGRQRIATLAIVIPVHDEEQLLARCLTAMDDSVRLLAARRPDIEVRVVVVLDACSDGSAEIAARFPVAVETIDVALVGAARAHGVGIALAGADPATTWIANTDADSAVPLGWATVHVDLAERGADLVLGTVRPDFADLSDAQIADWIATHEPGVAYGNTHGANLGMRADRYLAAGGFESVAAHEDVILVDHLREAGARTVATADCEVLTSGRAEGRAPEGYAAFLAANYG